MNIPNSILKELFRALAWFTTDPDSYRNIALSCKFGAKATKEFSPHKKKEFAETITMPTMKFSVLPNGTVHGLAYNFSHKQHYMYYNGKNNRFNDINNNSYGQFTKNLFIITFTGNSFYPFHNCYFSIKTRGRMCTAIKCDNCNKFHIFTSSGYKFMYASYCDGSFKKYKYLYPGVMNNPLSLRFMRNSIAKSVIQYAKSLN
jgi:hypothetical protein